MFYILNYNNYIIVLEKNFNFQFLNSQFNSLFKI